MINVNGSNAATLNFQSSPSDVKVKGDTNPIVTASRVEDNSSKLDSAKVEISRAELIKAVETINQAIVPRSLNFREDDTSGRSVITVVDTTNDEVIRQIPAEEVLKVSRDIKRLQEEMAKKVGVLVDSQV